MAREDLAFIAALLPIVCVVPYLRDTLRGTTRPQRVSWFVFAALSIVAAVSQLAEGATAGAWLSSGSALGFTLVAVASVKHGEGGATMQDRIALLIAMAGIAGSLLFRVAMLALLAVIVAELVAVSLTVRKAYRDPSSETSSAWALDGLAGVAALLAIVETSWTAVAYPLHHVAVNAAVLVAIATGRYAARGKPLIVVTTS